MKMQKQIKVYVERCKENVVLPAYANPGDAGMDVCAAEDIIIHPGECKVIPTGLKIGIPEGYEVQVRPRSGLSLHTPLRVANAPGTIDSGYRNEVGILMHNTSCPDCTSLSKRHVPDHPTDVSLDITMEQTQWSLDTKGNQKGTYIIQKGDRIAQLILMPILHLQWEEIDDISAIKGDRGGGFGSTGI